MAHTFLKIFDDYSVCLVNSIPVENWLKFSKSNYLIRRITNQNIIQIKYVGKISSSTSSSNENNFGSHEHECHLQS